MGILKLSQSTWKSIILRQASAERAPPAEKGLLAMMPTVLPARRANTVMAGFPKRGFSSNSLSLSTISRTTLRMS